MATTGRTRPVAIELSSKDGGEPLSDREGTGAGPARVRNQWASQQHTESRSIHGHGQATRSHFLYRCKVR